MSINFNKNGIIQAPYFNIKNLYTGKQANISNGILTYDYHTDIFKQYGFNTCLKLSPVENPNYSNQTTKQFMTYSYLLNAAIKYKPYQEYIVSLYAYVSNDCNAGFRIHLEQNNIWNSNYQNSQNNIVDSTKGEVIWVWGKCKANSNGNIYLMFYPNPNQSNVFTKGYQLFAGISVFEGSQLTKPINNNVSGSGIIENHTQDNIYISNNDIISHNFIEI